MIDPHQWVPKYAPYLHNIAVSRVKNMDEARDLIQDTFLAALEGQHQFKGNSSEKTWLTGILLNKIFDLYRKRLLEKAKYDLILNEQLRQHVNITDEDKLDNKEFLQLVELNLLKLPKLWSSVFRMKYLDEQPAEEICSLLSITSSNFWTITYRSKSQLRSYMQKID